MDFTDCRTFDIETNGINANKIHCLVADFNGVERATTSYDNMRAFFKKAKVVVGHNIARFDIPVAERILDIKIECKIVDTLALSWYLFPERQKHGLAEWGEEFGVPKPPIDDWENLPVEEYIRRCTEDVKINKLLWERQWNYLLQLYGDEHGAWMAIDYLSFKMDCAREQERSGWKLDVEQAKANLTKLAEVYEEKYALLQKAMPPVPIVSVKSRPRKPYKKNGEHSEIGKKWFSLLSEKGLPEDYSGTVETTNGEDPPNPGSTEQIKAWLVSYGWVPETFKYVMEEMGPFDKKPTFRKIPQVRTEKDGEKVLCPSVLKLLPRLPAIEHLEGITVLSHRMSILKGFLENVDENGFLKAEIGGLANTLRFKHRVIVNLPGVDKPYGKEIRGVLIAPEGYELCGSDMSSLEDRMKQHFIYPYDPEYVKAMMTPDFDPHLDLCESAGRVTHQQVLDYKSGKDKSIKGLRHKFKTVNYAAQYGVSPGGLRRNAGIPEKEGEELLDAYWKRNWAVKEAMADMTVKVVNGQKWIFNPVSKLWYSLRQEKDRLSTMCQGLGTYCFDMWVKEIRKVRPQLTAQFHDEVVLCVKKGFRKQAEELLQASIQKVNDMLKLNRELGVTVQFGNCYADIH